MCGISAIASHNAVSGKLFQCLLNLEYRGYDSCGMALYDEQTLSIRKNIGNVEEVNAKEQFSEMKGTIGIAHTRWATHGAATEANAHPHYGGYGFGQCLWILYLSMDRSEWNLL